MTRCGPSSANGAARAGRRARAMRRHRCRRSGRRVGRCARRARSARRARMAAPAARPILRPRGAAAALLHRLRPRLPFIVRAPWSRMVAYISIPARRNGRGRSDRIRAVRGRARCRRAAGRHAMGMIVTSTACCRTSRMAGARLRCGNGDILWTAPPQAPRDCRRCTGETAAVFVICATSISHGRESREGFLDTSRRRDGAGAYVVLRCPTRRRRHHQRDSHA